MEHPAPRLHPLLIIAAVSVTAVSLAGIGVLTGVIPAPHTATTVQAPEAAPLSPAAPQATPLPAQAAGAPIAPAAPVAVAPPTPPAASHVAHKAIKAMADKEAPAPRKTARNEPAPSPLLPPPDYAPPPQVAAPPVCRECGVVQAVHEVVQEGQGTGLGAVAGGVVGGVIGNQIGSGGGRSVARIVGMVGGAVAGNEIEKAQRKTVHYDIVVRMDDGTSRTVSSEAQPAWRAGDRVKISNGVLIAGS